MAARPASARLADAVTEALLLITTRPALRDAFLDTTAEIAHPLTTAIAERAGDTDQHTAGGPARNAITTMRLP